VSADARLQGHYAGSVSRLLAWLIDLAVSSISLSAIIVASVVVFDVINGDRVQLRTPPAVGVTATTAWLALYLFVSWAVPGRTPGQAFLGLHVIRSDGADLGWLRAAVRVATFPLSFILGIGFLGIVLGRRHRAFHDACADSVVIFDW
jgi:uncharacterized RDD family membrane protein YckC